MQYRYALGLDKSSHTCHRKLILHLATHHHLILKWFLNNPNPTQPKSHQHHRIIHIIYTKGTSSHIQCSDWHWNRCLAQYPLEANHDRIFWVSFTRYLDILSVLFWIFRYFEYPVWDTGILWIGLATVFFCRNGFYGFRRGFYGFCSGTYRALKMAIFAEVLIM